jgi:Ca2+-binding EF-hand superfamily protein
MKEREGEASRQQHQEMISTWRESRAVARKSIAARTAQVREMQAGRVEEAVTRIKQRNAAAAQSLRQQRDEHLSRHLMGKDGGPRPRAASAQECEQFSILLNQRMVEIFTDPQARSWYKLFVHMDDDLSGKINYHELEDMVRNELKVPNSRFSEDQLKGIWLALDEDESGLITTGEFGKLMRLGAHIHEVAETGRLKSLKAKKAVGAATRQEKDGLREELSQMRTTEKAANQSKVAEMHNVAWGMQAPADPRQLWR